ncbi:MAG: hemerythrin domain-containing protein [Sediminibacterium sp.]|nr:hemerythrin domain-containing protein [Sediminibacterium sp.]MDP3128461.1 hemerythrin domain-containing protein [Sediminibacterium sp.]
MHHHFYVKKSIATIYAPIEKVAAKHGERYPNIQKVLALFTEVVEELLPHMEKEELVLFPRIKEIAAIDTTKPFIAMDIGFLTAQCKGWKQNMVLNN